MKCDKCGRETDTVCPGPPEMLGVGGPLRLLSDEDEAIHQAARLEYYGRADGPPVIFPRWCVSCADKEP